ncbi:MAG: hypothetical protein M3332_06560 [Actinomycetota bacterium]|nr:hypothetical protein [Actinomycetota bacterium]
MKTVVCDPELEKVHQWIHTNLIILDAKSQAILSLYSIVLAALTILYSTLDGTTPAFVVAAILLAFALITWALVPLARISFVYWSTTEDFQNIDAMLHDLLKLRDVRTLIVRRSLMKGGVAMIPIAVVFAWQLAQRI